MKRQEYVGICLLLVGIISLGVVVSAVPHKQKSIPSQDTVYSFQKNVFPLLQAKCNPCHYEVEGEKNTGHDRQMG